MTIKIIYDILYICHILTFKTTFDIQHPHPELIYFFSKKAYKSFESTEAEVEIAGVDPNASMQAVDTAKFCKISK